MTNYQKRMSNAIANARSHMRELKRVSPYIFPEWQALQNAKDNLKRAKAELERAEAAWEALASDNAAIRNGGAG